jgi:hypothetical protein
MEDLYTSVELPFEFLKDPSYWLEAEKMEDFLATAQKVVHQRLPDVDNFAEELGAQSAELRSWGVLDGVLRMLQKPQDIFAKPERFISYFVSPAPPIANIIRTSNSISFLLPIAKEEYPLTLSYLKAAMESLPTFVGQNSFQVDWQKNQLSISWQTQQDTIFTEGSDPGHIMRPELMQSLTVSLEQSQKDLEDKNKELMLTNIELEKAKLALEKTLLENQEIGETTNVSSFAANELHSPISYVQSNIHRLQDYMARSQQLITLLVGQGRKDRQVQEAMRRVDWEYVQKEFPQVVSEIYDGLLKIRKVLSETETSEIKTKTKSEAKDSTKSRYQLPLQ